MKILVDAIGLLIKHFPIITLVIEAIDNKGVSSDRLIEVIKKEMTDAAREELKKEDQ